MAMTTKLIEWTIVALVFCALFIFKWAAILVTAVVVTALTLT
jgi:predicted signal transduction protein with EAL and GGDEF domain